MKKLSADFLKSIVWIDAICLNKIECKLDVVCIEKDSERKMYFFLTDIIYFAFRQEDENAGFEVIDSFYEPFNDCKYVDFMKSEKRNDYSILRFHS